MQPIKRFYPKTRYENETHLSLKQRKMSRTYVFSIPVGPGHLANLPKTLSSLAAQPVPVKVALCDASDKEACKTIADAFPDLIKYRRHGPDSGQSAAINEGWCNLDGDIYSWLNADDYLAPDALQKIDVIFEKNPNTDVVYGQSLIQGEDGSFSGLHPAVSPNLELLSRANIISQPSCFYTRQTLDNLGMVRDDLEYVMDWELWVRFMNANKKFVYTPEVLSTVLWEKGTKTSALNKHRRQEIRRLTSSGNGPYTVAKTQIGFALHYLGEYSRFSPIISRLLGLAITGKARRPVLWQAHESTAEMVRIKIYHYNNTPMDSLTIKFFEAVTGKMHFDGHMASLQNQKEITLPASLAHKKIAYLETPDHAIKASMIDKIIPHFQS